MAYKIHLQRNKDRSKAVVPVCASGNLYYPKATRNSRTTYQSIPDSAVLPFADFKVANRSDCCSHCVEAGLIIRNRQRRAKGLAPVESIFA